MLVWLTDAVVFLLNILLFLQKSLALKTSQAMIESKGSLNDFFRSNWQGKVGIWILCLIKWRLMICNRMYNG